MPEGLLRATAQPRPCRHIVFSGVKRLGGCVRRQERSSLSTASRHQHPDQRLTRARHQSCRRRCKPSWIMADAPEIGPAPPEKRKVVAMQLQRKAGDQAGARTAAHQGEQYPTARNSIGVLGDTGYAAKASCQSNGGHHPVRPSLCVLRPIERIASECIVVAVQSLQDFQADYEVGASSKRQCPVGVHKPANASRNLYGETRSRRPRRLRRVKGT
jgi:hypothetical protein